MAQKKPEKCEHLRLNAIGDPKDGDYRCTRCGAWFKAKKWAEAFRG